VHTFNTFCKAYIFLPFLDAESGCGGLLVALRFAELLGKYLPTEIVTYQNRHPGIPFIEDITRECLKNSLCVITWGPHINRLVQLLKGQKVTYFAQSFGWDMNLTPDIPILCVSRYVMTQWTYKSPANQVFLMPPVIGKQCTNKNSARDIDILVLSRKSSTYLTSALLPELEKQHDVYIVNDYIPQQELYLLFNRSKVYIYSTPAILSSGGQEGFGLQPLEALICGCRVFSNLNGGLCDFLDPSINMSQLGGNLLAYDLHRIGEACTLPSPQQNYPEELANRYSADAASRRLETILPTLDSYYSFLASNTSGCWNTK
jgi:glycosyltransferase involved in cell wall biosynthesis